MTKPVAWRSDVAARRSEGTGVTGAGPAGVSGAGRERGPHVWCQNRGGDGAALAPTPAAPGMSPPRVGLGRARRSSSMAQSRKGARGVAGCGGDPAPAPQLLFSSLTSGRRQQLGTCSSAGGVASSCCGVPANSIAPAGSAGTLPCGSHQAKLTEGLDASGDRRQPEEGPGSHPG